MNVRERNISCRHCLDSLQLAVFTIPQAGKPLSPCGKEENGLTQGCGGRAPTVLPCLLVLKNKCAFWRRYGSKGFDFEKRRARWQQRIGVLECYHVIDTDGRGDSLSIVSIYNADLRPEEYADNLRKAARWFDEVAHERGRVA